MLTYNTIERNFPSGSCTAWWSDSAGHLCHRTFFGYTKREIIRLLRSQSS